MKNNNIPHYQDSSNKKTTKYLTVRTVLKYHTVGTVLKYHTVRTVLKYHTVRTVLKSNRKIVERGKIDTSNTYIQ